MSQPAGLNQKISYSDYPSSSSTLLDSGSDTTQEDNIQEDIRLEEQDVGGTTTEDNVQEDIKFEKRGIKAMENRTTMRSELTRILEGNLTANEIAEQARLKEFSGTAEKDNTDTVYLGKRSKTLDLILKEDCFIKFLWVACL
ncbi:hypothetical protein TEQG_07166 [Trichophyton equinum CBS 127.97]|uniref:Uncharacterized protein n=1 Tax=Trichophyton equinum (strain ATCC MYA-4606 / CBS 127.97) TaxID=559882 RepID=F2Q271_TRIEC|nr:hypothetical protein TEQG_07166 [Trichophyton equinum CBS 127.97]